MWDDPLSLFIAWVGVAIVLGWTWLPAFLSGLGGVRAKVHLSDVATFDHAARDPAFQAWDAQIQQAGFRPCGEGSLRIGCAAAKWRWDTALVVYAVPREFAYIIIQQQAAPVRVWTPVIVATCWTNGGLLLTNNAQTTERDEGDYTTQGLETNDLQALLELHRSEVQSLANKGFRLERELTLETLTKAFQQHMIPAAREQFIRQGQTFLALRLVIHAFVMGPLVWIGGWSNVGLPVVNLILGCLFAYSDFSLERKLAKDLRERHAPPPDRAG